MYVCMHTYIHTHLSYARNACKTHSENNPPDISAFAACAADGIEAKTYECPFVDNSCSAGNEDGLSNRLLCAFFFSAVSAAFV